MVLAWENLQWGFCGVDCCSSSLLFLWYWLLFFIHCCFCDVVFHSLLFDVMPHSSVSYRRVFTPILYFQPSSSQRDWQHFHFNLSGPFFHSFIASVTVLSGHFLTTFIFYLTLLPHIFVTTCVYQGLPGSWQFLLEVCRVSFWLLILETYPAHLFVWFTAIFNLDIQKNSYLNCTKYCHELLVVKSLVICSLLVSNTLGLFKVIRKGYGTHFEQGWHWL